jgi:hypothetical protein
MHRRILLTRLLLVAVVIAAAAFTAWLAFGSGGNRSPSAARSPQPAARTQKSAAKLSLPAVDGQYLERHLGSPIQKVQAKALVGPLRASYLRHRPMLPPGVTVQFVPGTFHYYDLAGQRYIPGPAKVAVVTAVDSTGAKYLVLVFRTTSAHPRWLIGNAQVVNS